MMMMLELLWTRGHEFMEDAQRTRAVFGNALSRDYACAGYGDESSVLRHSGDRVGDSFVHTILHLDTRNEMHSFVFTGGS